MVKYIQYALPDRAGVFAGIDPRPDTGLLVVLYNWCSLVVEDSQSLFQCFRVIVGSLDQRLAGDVVLHGLLRWVEHFVVRSSRGWMNESTRYAIHQELIVYLQLDRVFEWLVVRFQHAVQPLCLRDCAWESVKDEAARISNLDLSYDPRSRTPLRIRRSCPARS